MAKYDEIVEGLVAKTHEFYGEGDAHTNCVMWDEDNNAPYPGLFDQEVTNVHFPDKVILPLRSIAEPQWNLETAKMIVKTQAKRKLN